MRQVINPFLKQALFWGLLMVLGGFLQAQDASGKISGIVVDGENGEPVIGANVYLEGMTLGAATDVDGAYLILNVPVGSQYTVVYQMLNYSETRITGVEVVAGENTRLDVTLKPEAIAGEEVVVEARAIMNNEAILLKERQKAAAVSDAISAEDISRSGSGNAAEAMTKVTGASVMDGKYVFIRGLGDRYSGTMLNGTEVPSADPDRKTVQMDLFPANLLDNIVTQKTFTPDKPGSFSGGMVEVSTKAYPDQLILKYSSSTSYNSLSTGNNQFLTYPGGDDDWLGKDDGTRELPSIMDGQTPPPLSTARRDEGQAQLLDDMVRAFQPVMAPSKKAAPWNQSHAFSFGNQHYLGDRPLGYVFSLTYSRKFNFYDGGTLARWDPLSNASLQERLPSRFLFEDNRGLEEADWGGVFTFSSKPFKNHELTGNVFYSQSGQSEARYVVGTYLQKFGEEDTQYENRVLHYTERNLQSYQMNGEHFFPMLLGMKLDWRASYAETKQDEPDHRYFTSDYSVSDAGDTSYQIILSQYPGPSRNYRSMTEDGQNFSFDIAMPLPSWNKHSSQLKAGGYFSGKDRLYDAVQYSYSRTLGYDGDPYGFFRDDIGITSVDTFGTNIFYNFGRILQLTSDASVGRFDGTDDVNAGYFMFDMPLTSRLRAIAGARYEDTEMVIGRLDSSYVRQSQEGRLKRNDWLPSLNMVYLLWENMNLRASYGKTLARPTLREMSPFASYQIVGGFYYVGNPDLTLTTIDNYDLRWEWFMRPGEVVAVSGFYKKFKNPIEKSILLGGTTDNPTVTYTNVDDATLYGLEFEFRKGLDGLANWLQGFGVGMNLSLVKSSVDIAEDRLFDINASDPDRVFFTDNTRPLQGQSPYIFNLDLGYANYRTGTAANLFYNIFGDRIYEVAVQAAPDIYERSRSILDFNMSQRLIDGVKLKLAISNLLDENFLLTQAYKGQDFKVQEYKMGRTYSIGFTYEL